MNKASLLRNGPLRALLAAEVVSMTGSQMTWLALPWFVLVTSGSATRMTLVMAAELIGLALLGLPGGRLLARLGARRTMLWCDAIRAPLMALIPVLHWMGALSFPGLLTIALVLGAVTAPYFAATKVIVPELLGEDERVVAQANALLQFAVRLTMLLGPVLAGVLIGIIGATSVLLVDAASYAVSVALVGAFVPRRAPVRSTEEEEQGILAGLRFLLRDRLLRNWNAAFAIGDTAWIVFFITVPVLVLARFDADPKIAGGLFASFGVGALAGNVLAYRYLLQRVDGLRLIATCVMGQALPLWLLPLPLPAAALGGALLVSGLANGLVNPSIHTIMTLRIPPALRPTAMTAMMLVFAVAQPIGLFGAGPVLDSFGATPVLVAFAATQTATMAAVVLTCLRARAVPEPSPARI